MNCAIIFTLIFFAILQYSAKLLKKPDQCRAVYACSHLFWVNEQDGVKDGERYIVIYTLLCTVVINQSCLWAAQVMVTFLSWIVPKLLETPH